MLLVLFFGPKLPTTHTHPSPVNQITSSLGEKNFIKNCATFHISVPHDSNLSRLSSVQFTGVVGIDAAIIHDCWTSHCPSLSLSLSLSLPLDISLYIYIPLPLYASIPISLPISLPISVSLFPYPPLSLSVSPCLCLSSYS